MKRLFEYSIITCIDGENNILDQIGWNFRFGSKMKVYINTVYDKCWLKINKDNAVFLFAYPNHTVIVHSVSYYLNINFKIKTIILPKLKDP